MIYFCSAFNSHLELDTTVYSVRMPEISQLMTYLMT